MYVDIIICVLMYITGRAMLNYAPSIKVGFRFKDPSIQKPLIPLSVSYRVVIYGTSIAVAAFLYLLETCFALRQVDKLYWKFMFGWLSAAIFNMFVKSFVGRLRPSFLAMNRVTSTSSSPEGFSEDHVLPEPKTGIDKVFAMESRKSFFSGHSAMGMYSGMFIAIYSYDVLPRSPLVFLLQVVSLLLGMYPGLTQWRNYWHHWDDVAVGYALGAVSAFMTYFYVFGLEV